MTESPSRIAVAIVFDQEESPQNISCQSEVNPESDDWSQPEITDQPAIAMGAAVIGLIALGPEAQPSGSTWAGREEELMRVFEDGVQGGLYKYAKYLTLGNHHAAEDLLQETALRLFRSADRMRADVGSVLAYAATIMRNHRVDRIRAANVRPSEAPDDFLKSRGVRDTRLAPDSIEEVLDRRLLMQLLADLSSDHKRVLFEVYFNDRPYAEIAKLLDIPEGTVKSRVHLAIRAARKKVVDMDPPVAGASKK